MWKQYFGLGLGLVWLLPVSCLWLLLPSLAHAEPIAQVPLGEFKQLIGRVDKLKQREKLQQELIGHLQEKDRVHTDYIAKMEAADEQREKYLDKLELLNAQLLVEGKDKQLSTLAEGAGYGATAAVVIGVVVRKLILKF